MSFCEAACRHGRVIEGGGVDGGESGRGGGGGGGHFHRNMPDTSLHPHPMHRITPEVSFFTQNAILKHQLPAHSNKQSLFWLSAVQLTPPLHIV